jgi:hypothetical protein
MCNSCKVLLLLLFRVTNFLWSEVAWSHLKIKVIVSEAAKRLRIKHSLTIKTKTDAKFHIKGSPKIICPTLHSKLSTPEIQEI